MESNLKKSDSNDTFIYKSSSNDDDDEEEDEDDDNVDFCNRNKREEVFYDCTCSSSSGAHQIRSHPKPRPNLNKKPNANATNTNAMSISSSSSSSSSLSSNEDDDSSFDDDDDEFNKNQAAAQRQIEKFNARQKEHILWNKESTNSTSQVPELETLSQNLLKELELAAETNESLKSSDLVQSLANKRLRDELAELRLANERQAKPVEQRSYEVEEGYHNHETTDKDATLKHGLSLELNANANTNTNTSPSNSSSMKTRRHRSKTPNNELTATTSNSSLFEVSNKFKTWPTKTSSSELLVASSVSPNRLIESTSSSLLNNNRESSSQRRQQHKSRTNSFESAKDEFNSVIDENRLATVDEDNANLLIKKQQTPQHQQQQQPKSPTESSSRRTAAGQNETATTATTSHTTGVLIDDDDEEFMSPVDRQILSQMSSNHQLYQTLQHNYHLHHHNNNHHNHHYNHLNCYTGAAARSLRKRHSGVEVSSDDGEIEANNGQLLQGNDIEENYATCDGTESAMIDEKENSAAKKGEERGDETNEMDIDEESEESEEEDDDDDDDDEDEKEAGEEDEDENDDVNEDENENDRENTEGEHHHHHQAANKADFNRTNSKKSNKSANESGLTSPSKKMTIRNKTKEGFKKVFSRFEKAMKNVQNRAEEVLNEREKSESESDDMSLNDASKTVKYKRARANKGSYVFNETQIIQILTNSTSESQNDQNDSSTSAQHEPNSIIWVMKFSPCGKLLATAGKDQILKIWVLRSYQSQLIELIKKHNNNSEETLFNPFLVLNSVLLKPNISSSVSLSQSDDQTPFYSRPFLNFKGHVSDILDVSWSKNLFVLSASSDKTCRLWHIYKPECLCVFHHSSIISAVSFHPKDERYFLSACIDGKFRLWNVAEKKIALWNDVNNLNPATSSFITAVSFCQGGKTIAVGTFDGKCILYHTEHLKYYSLINVRSTRGRNSKGSKITGIEVFNTDENKILITSNDSRIRLYDLRDLSLVCKYRGFSNSTVHIRASLSHDDKHIICGSKNKCTYLWKTNYHFSMLTSGRRDRNKYWERIQSHNAVVTCAIFSPKPQLISSQLRAFNSNTKEDSNTKVAKSSNSGSSSNKDKEVYVFLSAAGCDGSIKVFINKLK